MDLTAYLNFTSAATGAVMPVKSQLKGFDATAYRMF